MAQLHIEVRPHWLNGWFLRAFAHPVVDIDDHESVPAWGRAQTFAVESGHHHVQTSVRYKGMRTARCGQGGVDVDAAAGAHVHIAARNGWSNQSPFIPTVLD